MAVLCPAHPPSASRGCPYAVPLVLEACCTPARVCTRLSLHDSAQQEPTAAPPRVRARLNQSLKALIAFDPPLGGVGLSGDGPRGAGSPGRSRAGRAVEKPWRGGGAGELLGGTGGWVAGGRGAAGGWDCVKSGFIFPIRSLFDTPYGSMPPPDGCSSRSYSWPMPASSPHRPTSSHSSAPPKCLSTAQSDYICCGRAGNTVTEWAYQCDPQTAPYDAETAYAHHCFQAHCPF